MDAIGEQFEARDKFAKRYYAQMAPAQRMLAMARLQNSAWDILRKSADGYAHFLRRNFKARAVKFRPTHGS
jgi:hypothetical protein